MPKVRRKSAAVLGLLAAFVLDGALAQEQWSYEIVPYLWAASLDGRQGVGGHTADVSEDFSDVVEFVNAGAALRFEARRQPVTWFAEASYVELESDATTPAGPVRVESTQIFGEVGLMYEFRPQLGVYGALRFQEFDTELQLQATRVGDTNGWVDAVAGVRWMPLRTESWAVWARGDIGAGGSDLIWLAELGAGYRWGTRWGAYAAYRILDTDYEKDEYIYDMQEHGLLLGFGIRF